MADQIEISIPKTVVDEETNFIATAYFRTRATAAADTPSTVHYRIDNLTTQTTLADWTSVSAASSVSISVTPTHNAIEQNSSPYERHQIIVQADRGTSTQATGSKVWRVQNIYGINSN